jgi:hypothetical protein
MLTLNNVVARSPRPFTAQAADELVMLDPGQGRYFGLDAVGNRVWELLETPRSVGDLCSALTGEFVVDAASCQRDVLAFLQQLADADLLDIVT